MATKAFEIDFGVIMRGPHADGGMAKLVESPVRRIMLPERIHLAIGKTRIPIGREIGSLRKPGLAMRDKKRA